MRVGVDEVRAIGAGNCAGADRDGAGVGHRVAHGTQPVRLAGSFRCWFVKKYCWLVCVKEKYCSG